jgi:hypothetical protein
MEYLRPVSYIPSQEHSKTGAWFFQSIAMSVYNTIVPARQLNLPPFTELSPLS